MWKVLKRQWKYVTAKLSGTLEERADPKVQLEQAITEAQEQHRRLVEQAANVVARQKQTELQLNRAMDELGKINQSTRQALTLAQQAQAGGDATKAAEYNQAAEGFANRMLATEKHIDDLKTMSLQTAQASEQAKAAVQQNSMALQERLAERQKLLSQLDQAKMQEQLNAATTELQRSVGNDVPTLDQVREKIETRYARAVGTAEIGGSTVESRMLEVQQAALGSEAQSRLEQMRQQMGIAAAPGSTPDVLGNPAASELGTGRRDQEGDADEVPSPAETTDFS
jgi:phage shock protein A